MTFGKPVIPTIKAKRMNFIRREEVIGVRDIKKE
jgi:hypothetical protein